MKINHQEFLSLMDLIFNPKKINEQEKIQLFIEMIKGIEAKTEHQEDIRQSLYLLISELDIKTAREVLAQCEVAEKIQNIFTWSYLFSQKLGLNNYKKFELALPPIKEPNIFFNAFLDSKATNLSYLEKALDLGYQFKHDDWQKHLINKITQGFSGHRDKTHLAFRAYFSSPDINPFSHVKLDTLQDYFSNLMEYLRIEEDIDRSFNSLKERTHIILENKDYLFDRQCLLYLLTSFQENNFKFNLESDTLYNILTHMHAFNLSKSEINDFLPVLVDITENKNNFDYYLNKQSQFKKYKLITEPLTTLLEKVKLEESLNVGVKPQKKLKI